MSTTPVAPALPPVVKGRCGLCGGAGARLYARGWRDEQCAPPAPPNPNANAQVAPLIRKAA